MKKGRISSSRPAPGGLERPSESLVEGRKLRHEEVLDALLGEIASGRLSPGDRLPTETELAKTFSLSRSTIARAMRELKGRGLLSRHRGGGTHIAKLEKGHRIALFASFAQSANLGYIGGQIYGHLSDLASRRADDLGLQLIGHTAEGVDRLEPMMAAARALIDKGVRGVFYYPVELPQAVAHYNQLVVDKLRDAKIAVLAVDRDIVSFPERSDLPVIAYDNRRGGYLVTDHMIKRGRRRIAFVGSPFASSAASDRMRGYFDAMEENELVHDRSMVFRADLNEINADFCRRLMAQAKPDAIVCKMDHYAALLGRHLVGMGLTIGRDVLLAGFDDEPLAELLPVPLTTIRFPADPFARICYDRMMEQIASPNPPEAAMTLVNVELVVRESTGS